MKSAHNQADLVHHRCQCDTHSHHGSPENTTYHKNNNTIINKITNENKTTIPDVFGCHLYVA